METDVRILEIQPCFTREQSRTPLKFGGVVMDSAWLCHVRVLVENRRGQRGEGWGAIFLSDVWGWPSRCVDHPQREDLMVRLVESWCRRLGKVREFAHPIDLFWELEPELEPLARDLCRDAGAAEEMPRLNALICASAADAAVHDAFGNAAGIDTYLGYGPEHMGSRSFPLVGAVVRGTLRGGFSPSPAGRGGRLPPGGGNGQALGSRSHGGRPRRWPSRFAGPVDPVRGAPLPEGQAGGERPGVGPQPAAGGLPAGPGRATPPRRR